ncbi:hypothetical protein TI39_contig320g00014 [Zymoseptoria brevis]|uniref:Uncharacterized protein n=1 Tax=Zymoseptoria brevis TaxID=1047168 RepID=A0A0F4GWS0_9PEZI|nr:hypothetical protein TI39_contig320g00014 [Zymoseptoria brevis]
MEAILFYGDGGHRDEATRRQVRSVAAQYSHRIGPRKRKAAVKPPTKFEEQQLQQQLQQQQQDDKYKKIASVPPAAGDASGSRAGAAGPSQPPTYYPNHPPPPPLAFVAQHPSHDAAPPDSGPPGVSGARPLPNVRWQPHWQPAPYAPGGPEGLQRPVSEGHPQQHNGTYPPQYPHPPQYHLQHDPYQQHHQQHHYQYPQPQPQSREQQRPESSRALHTPQATPASHFDHNAPRPQSQSTTPSSAIRLPEYSWTEYPRYSPHSESFGSMTPSPERSKPNDRRSADFPRPSLPMPILTRPEPPRTTPISGEPPPPSPTAAKGLDVFLTGRKMPSSRPEQRGTGKEREVENTSTPLGQAPQGDTRMQVSRMASSTELPPLAMPPRDARQDSSLARTPG